MGIYSEILLSHTEIQDRIKHSRKFLDEVRSTFATMQGGKNSGVCVFAAGSLGRFEAGRKSDLDVFIISRSPKTNTKTLSKLQEIELFSDLIRLNEKLDLPSFSGDGRFLKVHQLNDLIGATGDPRDDSENLFTTRLLLLLESQTLSNETLYKLAIKSVLKNYFRDGKDHQDFQPLFLLNDILRYWRTLCLNYERDRGLERPWWKKNLNLKFSRKLTVFSTVLAIVSKEVKTASDFEKLTRKVPLERLAIALDSIDDRNFESGFKHMLTLYESFLAAKSYAELDMRDAKRLEEFRTKANNFGNFIHNIFQSKRLDQTLVKYLAI